MLERCGYLIIFIRAGMLYSLYKCCCAKNYGSKIMALQNFVLSGTILPEVNLRYNKRLGFKQTNVDIDSSLVNY